MAWQKGKSGNPGGRPKEDSEVKDLARKYTKEAVTKLVEWMRSENPKASVSACQALLDRGFGKPAQSVDMKITDDRPDRDSILASLADLHARLAGRSDGRGTEPASGTVPPGDTTH
jgi:erythromycin esterase-like protein